MTDSSKPDPRFKRFEVRIHDFARQDTEHLVTAKLDQGDLSATGTFDLSQIPDESVTAALDAMDSGGFEADAAADLGRKLFEGLFQGDIGELYREATEQGPARMQLVVDVENMQGIPWELMHDGDSFLSLSSSIARGISTLEPATALATPWPLRILIVDAYPRGVAPLSNKLEARHIESALTDLSDQGRVETCVIDRATPDRLLNKLREAAALPNPQPYHVLHFIGHGVHDPADGTSYLLFERDDTHEALHVAAEDFVNLVGPYGLRLVFLNACQTAETSTRATADTFAHALLESGVPALIGMQTRVYDEIAVRFAQLFYEAIADNSPVDVALSDARRLVDLTDVPDHTSLGVPVCYLRSRSGRILDLQEPEGTPEDEEPEEKPPWWKTTYGVVTVATTILGIPLLIIAYLNLLLPWIRGPGQMNATKFNVAVAEITPADGVDASLAADLTDRLFEQLEADMSELGFGDVWGPDKTGRVSDVDADTRADEINADIVLYGSLTPAGELVDYQPEFFVNDRWLTGEQQTELTGAHSFGEPERFVWTSLAAINQLEGRLAARSEALAHFVIGLSEYAISNYEQAAGAFEAAEDVDGWDDEDGKEILFLFRGNTAGRLQDVDTAEQMYASALEIRSDYSRALIGSAEVLYQNARGSCFEGIDPDGMAQSEDRYEAALATDYRPPLADIAEKVAFGLGRVYLCEQLAGLGIESPQPHFAEVIDAFEGGNSRLAELAWESHAGLGLYFGFVPSVSDADMAVSEYMAAIDLVESSIEERLDSDLLSERLAVFYANMGSILASDGEESAALDALNKALELSQAEESRSRIQSEIDRMANP